MKDKQPRRPSKPAALEKTVKPSAMGKRAKGGDKVSNPGTGAKARMKGADQTSQAPRGGQSR